MILKGQNSLELPTLEQAELTNPIIQELMKQCRHPLMIEKLDPHGSVPIQVCAICGKEML